MRVLCLWLWVIPLVTACGDDEGSKPETEATTEERQEGAQPGDCTDDTDNDMDGLFDCADPGCAGSSACTDTEDDGGGDSDADDNTADTGGDDAATDDAGSTGGEDTAEGTVDDIGTTDDTATSDTGTSEADDTGSRSTSDTGVTDTALDCPGDFTAGSGPECCDSSAGYPVHTDVAATCVEGEWVCDGGDDFAVCTCGVETEEGPDISSSDCVESCEAVDASFPFCVYGHHWSCSTTEVFYSECLRSETTDETAEDGTVLPDIPDAAPTDASAVGPTTP